MARRRVYGAGRPGQNHPGSMVTTRSLAGASISLASFCCTPGGVPVKRMLTLGQTRHGIEQHASVEGRCCRPLRSRARPGNLVRGIQHEDRAAARQRVGTAPARPLPCAAEPAAPDSGAVLSHGASRPCSAHAGRCHGPHLERDRSQQRAVGQRDGSLIEIHPGCQTAPARHADAFREKLSRNASLG